MKSKGKISIESLETISDLVQAFHDGILRLENISNFLFRMELSTSSKSLEFKKMI